MFHLYQDEKGNNYVMVNCKDCGNELRVSCKDQETLDSWNEDLKDRIGAGLYISLESQCNECIEKERKMEKYYEKRDDASYQGFVHDDDKYEA